MFQQPQEVNGASFWGRLRGGGGGEEASCPVPLAALLPCLPHIHLEGISRPVVPPCNPWTWIPARHQTGKQSQLHHLSLLRPLTELPLSSGLNQPSLWKAILCNPRLKAPTGPLRHELVASKTAAVCLGSVRGQAQCPLLCHVSWAVVWGLECGRREGQEEEGGRGPRGLGLSLHPSPQLWLWNPAPGLNQWPAPAGPCVLQSTSSLPVTGQGGSSLSN